MWCSLQFWFMITNVRGSNITTNHTILDGSDTKATISRLLMDVGCNNCIDAKWCGHGFSIQFQCLFLSHRVQYDRNYLKRVSKQIWLNSWKPNSEIRYICIFVDILQSVLGLPSECTHNNVIRSCTLSFSCWIQGGHHVEGCGENKWLFSCCISDGETMDFNQYNGLIKPGSFFDMDLPARFNLMPKIKSQLMPSTPLSSSSTSSAAASMPSSSSSSSIFKKNMLRRRMDDNGMVKRKSTTFYSLLLILVFIEIVHQTVESIWVWSTTHGSKYHSKADHWWAYSTVCCVALASAHSYRWISMRRHFGITTIRYYCRTLHWTGAHERYCRLFGRIGYTRLGQSARTMAVWKTFDKSENHSSPF